VSSGLNDIVVSSAAGLGYGTLRAFEESVGWTSFGPAEIKDPRGVRRRGDDAFFVVNDPFSGIWMLELDGKPLGRIDLPAGLDPGGGAFGANGMYYVGSRAQRSIERVDLAGRQYRGRALTLDGIAFPRGFAVLSDGSFIVASGTDPTRGDGQRGLFRYDRGGTLDPDIFVDDPLLDPLDLGLRNNQVYVTSEYPFGKGDAVASLRRYDVRSGAITGIWCAENTPAFAGVRKPRGITFADDETLFMCAQNCVLAVDVTTFGRARIVAQDDRLAGQSLALGRMYEAAAG
jgi:hypothetical protein